MKKSFSVLLNCGGIREMFDTHRSTDSHHVVILFPTGAEARMSCEKSITSSVLFFQCRLNNQNVLLREYKLFQVYLRVMHAMVENKRPHYFQQNQQTLSSEKYRRICEDVTTTNNSDDIRSGRNLILPPSFTGSPRYLH